MGILEVLFGAGMVAGGLGVAFVLMMVGGTIWGIRRSAGWGKKNKRELPPSGISKPRPQLEAAKEYSYLNEDGTAKAADILKVAETFLPDPVMGPYAEAVMTAVEKSEIKRKGVYAAIEREFDKGTMTWEKFAVPVDGALDTIMRNCAALGNHIQRFETVEYQRLERLHEAGGIDEDSPNAQQWEILCDELNEMDGLQKANERLLIELDALSAELNRLAGSDMAEANDEILEELQQLTEDAKLYT